MIKKIIRFFHNHVVDFGLTIGAIFFTCFLHWVGVFDFLELKTYDYRFHSVRGPLTGWRASDSTIIKKGTDVVLVEVDDESWRLLKDNKVPWPYPRGDIWAKAVDNLSNAGAKVIAFDIQFDSPDARSEYLRSVSENLPLEFQQYLPGHGDILLAESIQRAQENGTKVVMDVKMVREPTRIPPNYIAYPVPEIMGVNPETGLINDMLDIDGFSRQYSIAGYMAHEPDKAYLTLGVKCVKAFQGIPDDAVPSFNGDSLKWTYGDLNITSYGRTNNFLVNYYGPPSGYKMPGRDELKPWGTFPRFSLSQILDTQDYDLPEDLDWMSQFLPGQIPEWIKSIDDLSERKEMMDAMGISEEFDVTKSPFYNKIVVIGTSVEVHHDYKQTPYYNFWGIQQLTPGMETHANAIQTLLDENYVNVMGGQLTELIYGYPLSHTILIAFLSLIAFFILSYLNPVTAGILIILEGFIYYAIVCGVFVNDLFWFIKSTLASIFPEKLMSNNPNLFNTSLPDIGESYVIPLVAPLAGLLVTYTGNVIYKFIVEQKDKKFLKNTFGAYISPDLIDQMYADKREPKLGGEAGYHTAFFSDIQSFSSFSEVLEPKKMVSLMNQYLTEMTNILLDHKGTLDKYIGDAIVAFYGAPVPLKDHEFHACLTALEMEKKLAIMRSEWANDSDWPELVHNIRHRVGLNSGEMVTGNMGSSMRMNYTMMGDTVNLAARLEPAAKHYGVYILVSEHTQKAVEDFFEWRFLDFLRVKGKKKPVRGYELISLKNEMTKDQSQLVQAFDEGIKLYNKQEWTKAKKLFKESLSMEEKFIDRPTTPSEVYLDRCDYFKAEPPGKNWDGIWTMKTK